MKSKSHPMLFAARLFAVFALLAAPLSGWFFRWSERRAQEKGLIDVTTHY